MSWDSNPIEEELGRIQVIITNNAGVNFDVSYINGVPVNVESIVSNEPFGDASALVDIPQITPFQPPQKRYGEFPDIDIFIVRPNNSKITMFQGFIADWDSTFHANDWMTQAICKGALYQYDLDVIPPPLYLPAGPLDVGKLIKDALDLHPTRVKPLVQVATNIFSMKAAGAGQPLLTGYIQDLLSTATQADGGQWTLVLSDAANTNRQPVMRLKDTRTPHWTMACGAPGVEHELSYDSTTGITTIFGEGIDSYGCFWRNTKYPNLHADTAPVWSSPVLLTIGVTDAESNSSVSVWQRFMQDSGFPVTVTHTFNAADRNSCIFLQQVAGINVDGIVGPQTWAATFQAGSNQGSLDGAFFAPLYSDPRVEKYLYNPDGGIKGTNPHYNPRVMRVEKWLNFGLGISKNLAIFMARIQYNRDRNPGWMGTITLTSDPDEGSRFEIRPGQNFRYKGFAGNVASAGGGLTTEALTFGMALNSPIVGAAPAHVGYWLVAADGGVFTYNGATYHGSMGGQHLNAPIVGIASTPNGGGYWLAASDGGVFAFGNAVYSGGEVGKRLNGAIIGIAGGPSNSSYWLVGADGGIFAFGGAPYYGSMAGFHLSRPIVAIDTTPNRTGYYLLGADGGVFTSNSRDGSFGTANYYGSMAGTPLSADMTSIAVTSDNTGYYLAAGDGGVFTFPRTGGNAPPFYGSLGSAPIEQIVSILVGDGGQSYRLIGADAATYVLGSPPPPVNEGVLLHVSQVEKNFVDLTVTLTVDEKARDLMTLDSIYQRNKQANDPALRPHPYHMNSIQTFDNIPVFDCESGAGIIPRMGTFANLWNVIHIPAGATGTIGQMKLTADDPGTKLAMAVFDRPITANELASAHGNALTDITFWTSFGETSGLIIGWGSVDQPGGFFPGSFTEGNSPTGVLVDNASWYYQTTSSPWLWVAILTDRTTFVQGRLLPAVG